MGFYHPSTLVKDAQRRGVRFHPIDVQISDWDCTVEPDGAIRLGLRYVSGLREQVGRAIASARPNRQSGNHQSAINQQSAISNQQFFFCPKCGCDDPSMLEQDGDRWFCNTCSHDWNAHRDRSAKAGARQPMHRFSSLDDLVARTGLRRDELVTLADVGALNAFGYDRRSPLWQAERAVRPTGELFDASTAEHAEHAEHAEIFLENGDSASSAVAFCPLK